MSNDRDEQQRANAINALARTARIGVVGAGCAGLTCAEELRERGYSRVTVLEAQPRVGGKVCSLVHREGARELPYEAGTVWFIPGPIYSRYVRRHGISTAFRDLPPVRTLDVTERHASPPLLIRSATPIASRLWQMVKLVRELRRHRAAVGFADAIYRARAERSSDWFAREGLGFVREAFGPLAAGAVMGPAEPDISAGYVLRLLALLRRVPLARQASLRLPQLPEGNQELWRRIAARHDVRLGAAVRRISRGPVIHVHTASGDLEFDALVWTAPVDDFLRVADATDEERQVFSRVRHLRRAVLTCKVDVQLPEAVYVVKGALDRGIPPSYPHVMFEVAPRSGIYSFYPYLADGTTSDELERQAAELVAALGGRGVAPLGPPRFWKWFPHFAADAVAAGMHERAEALQGQHRTWFAGELFAGVGVAYGTEYAAHLVERMTARE